MTYDTEHTDPELKRLETAINEITGRFKKLEEHVDTEMKAQAEWRRFAVSVFDDLDKRLKNVEQIVKESKK